MKPVNILVTNRSLSENAVLRHGDLQAVPVPEKYCPVGVIYHSDLESILGHSTVRPVSKGEMMMWSTIDTGPTFIGPSSRISNGYRVVSIPVTDSSSVAQAIRPGDRVDMVVTANIEKSGSSTTFTILQNISVFDVGLHIPSSTQDAYSTLSLMVFPKEIGLIKQALELGHISFALRHPSDHDTLSKLPMVSNSELIRKAFIHSLQVERDQQVEIIRGGALNVND